MSTNLEIIEDALRNINVISEVDTASAEQGTYGLRKLNQLMEMWKEDSIDVGWFAQSSTTDSAPIPDWAELAVVSALSVLLAPKYGATVSQELAAIVDNSINSVRRKLLAEKVDNADNSHLPRGQGWYGRQGYDIANDNT